MVTKKKKKPNGEPAAAPETASAPPYLPSYATPRQPSTYKTINLKPETCALLVRLCAHLEKNLGGGASVRPNRLVESMIHDKANQEGIS